MKWRLYRSVEIREQAESYKTLKTPINMGAGGRGPWCQSRGRGPGPVISNSLLTNIHSCFKVSLPPSVSFREKQNLVCHWLNIMIEGAVCRTKNRPVIQLCYPAVSCLRQVVISILSERLGQVQPFLSQFATMKVCNVENREHQYRSVARSVFRLTAFKNGMSFSSYFPAIWKTASSNRGVECGSK